MNGTPNSFSHIWFDAPNQKPNVFSELSIVVHGKRDEELLVAGPGSFVPSSGSKL